MTIEFSISKVTQEKPAKQGFFGIYAINASPMTALQQIRDLVLKRVIMLPSILEQSYTITNESNGLIEVELCK